MTARTLFLLRHAKSGWDDPALADFDRPLAPRGRQAAPLVGREMKKRGWLPDLALVSSARRTVETWKLAAAEFSEEPAVQFSRALYHAGPQELIAALRAVPESCRSVILVGHNPGLEELAVMLAGAGSDPNALGAVKEKFPTGALARFEFDEPWTELRTTTLTHFLRPKDLE
jgi:phosphohistidine phosphatase